MLERVPILHDFSALPLTSASTWRWRKFTSWLWYYCTGLLPRSWLDIICDVRGAQKLGDLRPRMELVTFCPGLKGTEPSRDRGKHVKLSTQHFSSSRAYFQEDGWLVTEYVCLILTGATLHGLHVEYQEPKAIKLIDLPPWTEEPSSSSSSSSSSSHPWHKHCLPCTVCIYDYILYVYMCDLRSFPQKSVSFTNSLKQHPAKTSTRWGVELETRIPCCPSIKRKMERRKARLRVPRW